MADLRSEIPTDPYAAYDAAGDDVRAEVIDDVCYLLPAPALRHSRAMVRLVRQLGDFDGGDAPGGWQILVEPELRLARPDRRPHIVQPDVAGWRVERLPELPDAASIDVVPDWVCEILSPKTAAKDRSRKMPLYASVGVRNAWLVDPVLRTLESYRLVDGLWSLLAVGFDDERVRVEPFDVELDLSALWATR